MTPKEQADSIINEFKALGLNEMAAKICAKVHAQKLLDYDILAPQPKRHYVIGIPPHIDELEYWQQVIKEIEKK